ncbi:MAG: gamma-glutamyltranspeptidase / glutathione hydrolase [Pyrinomonadaceae bacterium]|jgi:gamma-glutamyltranspeptidase/glutathione hydrolase|nr:gamma-glutamyltranspeptidase / glutathione hydrolase [Pyrinomonadaceae bacterium]
MKSKRTVPSVLTFAVIFVFLVSACLPFFQQIQPTALAASRQPVRARHGIVAATNQLAARVGVEVLQRGGNAIDAAVAIAFALAVTHPSAGNLGGGGFMMIRLKNGKTTAIDYREMAPAAATRNIYLDQHGNLIKGEGGSLLGYRAAGVPGMVRGMELALKKYGSGRLSWKQLIEPARQLAVKGFPVSNSLAKALAKKKPQFELYEDSRKIFLNSGKAYEEGEVLRQPDLAATLLRLQRNGAREFYEGMTARLIAADMKRHNGLITMADLKGYAAREREPVRGNYRGYEVITMPPPSSGGVILIEMLNILEGYNLKQMGVASADRYHFMAEAMRRAYADRAEYLGDADFASVPVSGLIDKDYAKKLRATIIPDHASTSAEIRFGNPPGAESGSTTHFTIVDAEGNAVANSYTLNDSYGSKVVAKGTGFLLNNEMDDFSAKPGTPNLYGLVQGERNAIAPRKRPLSAMTPTFVLRPDGSLWFAIGSPGGATIINTVLQIITNIVDYDMNLQQAIDAPRIHNQWLPDEVAYEPYALSEDTLRILKARGQTLRIRLDAGWTDGDGYMGDAAGVMIEEETGIRLGATDPRRSDGLALGY